MAVGNVSVRTDLHQQYFLPRDNRAPFEDEFELNSTGAPSGMIYASRAKKKKTKYFLFPGNSFVFYMTFRWLSLASIFYKYIKKLGTKRWNAKGAKVNADVLQSGDNSESVPQQKKNPSRTFR